MTAASCASVDGGSGTPDSMRPSAASRCFVRACVVASWGHHISSKPGQDDGGRLVTLAAVLAGARSCSETTREVQ